MKIANYIVVDAGTKFSDLKKGDGTYAYTADDQYLFPIGSILPVIEYNRRCCGLAKVVVCVLREETSTVYFKFVSKDNYPELFGAWKTQSGSSGTGSAGFGIPRHNPNGFNRGGRAESFDEDDDEEFGLSADDLRGIFG